MTSSSEMANPVEYPTAQILILGDPKTGRTSLVEEFTRNLKTEVESHLDFPRIPITSCQVKVDGKKLNLSIWDVNLTGLHHRTFPYQYADIIILVYSIDHPDSLKHVTQIWAPELKRWVPDTPILLVANKIDLREDPATIYVLDLKRQSPITFEEGKQVAKEIGASGFAECTEKNGDDVDDVFHAASKIALKDMQKKLIKDFEHRAMEKERKRVLEESKKVESKKKKKKNCSIS